MRSSVLFDVIRQLKQSGVSVIFVSHKLDELYAVCDRVTIMRDGRTVKTAGIEGRQQDRIGGEHAGARCRAGRQERHRVRRPQVSTSAQRCCRGSHLNAGHKVHDVSFSVRRGEIVGFAGLLGSGRTETARIVFGADPVRSGALNLEGKDFAPRQPVEAIDAGVGFASEDRKLEGIIPDMSVAENLTLALLPQLTRAGVVDAAKQRAVVEKFIASLGVRCSGPEQPIRELSGGNQQKVLLARWLAMSPKLLILDEPTRGIDVGAKAEIQKIIKQLAEDGLGVLMISSELEEVLEGSDRVFVLREGRSVAELPHASGERGGGDGRDGAWRSRRRACKSRRHDQRRNAPRTPVTSARDWRPFVARYATLAALIALIAFNFAFTNHFASIQTLNVNLTQVATIVIVGVGMTLVIATGGIDLSVGSLMAISGAVAPIIFLGKIVSVRRNSCRGRRRDGRLGRGRRLAWMVQRLADHALPHSADHRDAGSVHRRVAASRRSRPTATCSRSKCLNSNGLALADGLRDNPTVHGRSRSVFVLIVIVAAAAWGLKRSLFGRQILAIGGNERAARLGGRAGRERQALGLLHQRALRGDRRAGRASRSILPATPISSAWEWSSTRSPAVAVGGTLLSGGRATVGGTLIGALIIQLVRYTLLANGVPDDVAKLVKAALIVAAVWLQGRGRA